MIGGLKHRVTIQHAARAADGGGGFAETWQNLDDAPIVYAAIEQLSGGEKLRLAQLGAAITHRLTIRYRDDLTTAMRIVKGDAVYKIISLQDRDGTSVYMELLVAQA